MAGMSSRRRPANAIGDATRRLVLSIGIVATLLLAAAFGFPTLVGSVITTRGILIVSFTAFGSALAYIALLPDPDADRARERS